MEATIDVLASGAPDSSVAGPAPARTLTDRLKTRVDHLLVRFRTALDLPSRSEMLELTTRLEELDKRIAALAAERVAAMTETRLELPEPAATDHDAAKPKKKKA